MQVSSPQPVSPSSRSSLSSASSFEDEAERALQRRRARRRRLDAFRRRRRKGGGSRKGKTRNIDRQRVEHNDILMRDYFNDNCTYTMDQFRRRFRMRRSLFLRLLSDLTQADSYFLQRRDAMGEPGFSSHQKLTSALRILAYGACADQLDEYVRMAESTSLKNLQKFCETVIRVYGPTYLRAPTPQDVREIMERYEQKGWIGCLGCLDVMKWEWKNCPMAWRGAYQGKEKVPTVCLEGMVDSRLWFWHAFFGTPGANNDLNVIDQSPLFQHFIDGTSPAVKFTVNGNEYSVPYYLVDGIYPEWASLVKTVPEPVNSKQRLFAAKQESQRKDVERAFGVLQARFRILSMPCRLWDKDAMGKVIIACIILHNMVIDDEYADPELDNRYLTEDETFQVDAVNRNEPVSNLLSLVGARKRYMCNTQHRNLKHDLMEHFWMHH